MGLRWFIATSFFTLLYIFQQLKAILQSFLSIGGQFIDNILAFTFEIIFFPSYCLFQNILAYFYILPYFLIGSYIFRFLLITFFCLLYISLFLELSNCKYSGSESLDDSVELLSIGVLDARNVLSAE